jgi:hypothetical protein
MKPFGYVLSHDRASVHKNTSTNFSSQSTSMSDSLAKRALRSDLVFLIETLRM